MTMVADFRSQQLSLILKAGSRSLRLATCLASETVGVRGTGEQSPTTLRTRLALRIVFADTGIIQTCERKAIPT